MNAEVGGLTRDRESLADSVSAIKERVAAAAIRSGRDASDVRIIAATKSVGAETIMELLRLGFVDIGENRAQELLAKVAAITPDNPANNAAPVDLAEIPTPTWHFIGRLQSNKVRALAKHVSWWHSIDRSSQVGELGRHCTGAQVLIEVNTARDPAKAGCDPRAVPGLLASLQGANLQVCGLMTVPGVGEDPIPAFAALRELGDRFGLKELSMGMSDDFEVAIGQGATMIRVGRALFGERPIETLR